MSGAAALSIPFVMASGMWAMTFARVPMRDEPHGFAVLLLRQVAIAGIMVRVLRRRRLP